MKTYLVIALLAILLMGSCNKSALNSDRSATPEKLSSEQIDEFIRKKIETEQKFEWGSASDQMIFIFLTLAYH